MILLLIFILLANWDLANAFAVNNTSTAASLSRVVGGLPNPKLRVPRVDTFACSNDQRQLIVDALNDVVSMVSGERYYIVYCITG